MSQPSSSNGGFLDDLRQGHDQFLFLCRILAFPVQLCVTRFGTWGPRYLDFSAVLGFFWPVVFLAFAGPYPVGEGVAVIRFWWATLALLLIHRIAGVRRRAKGYLCHSRYWGESWFARPSDPPASDRSDAREFLAVFGIAVLLAAAVSRPLGVLLLIGCVALLVTRLVVRQAVVARLREMEDARIESEFYFERFRERTDRE
ncbi:hypothetical protein [Frigoriglobus tundricola]|uniref:Uncharacterized protein n=1 Tax=Frigoriglobus tundricola TaxID=2774151 RepID=A0A6M5YWY2_9BACT|nr:hypothetical protein [Frigoriglobus tundricola]QJW98438.1 hypothetical protein FTUN_6028 [Frigoriglobus tundricola]